MSLYELWRRITSTRYTRALEKELVSLRAENRALLNSILGIAGIPPVPVSESDLCPTCRGASGKAHGGAPPTWRNSRPADGTEGKHDAVTNHSTVHVAAPMRRRSWQQINRALELESARKKPQDPGN